MIKENTAGKRERDQKRGRREKTKIIYYTTRSVENWSCASIESIVVDNPVSLTKIVDTVSNALH